MILMAAKGKSTKRNDRPYSLPNSGGHVSQNVILREGADHCAASAFPYLYYRQPCADCQAPELPEYKR